MDLKERLIVLPQVPNSPPPPPLEGVRRGDLRQDWIGSRPQKAYEEGGLSHRELVKERSFRLLKGRLF